MRSLSKKLIFQIFLTNVVAKNENRDLVSSDMRVLEMVVVWAQINGSKRSSGMGWQTYACLAPSQGQSTGAEAQAGHCDLNSCFQSAELSPASLSILLHIELRSGA